MPKPIQKEVQELGYDLSDVIDRVDALEEFNKQWKSPCTPSFLTTMRQDMEEMKNRIEGFERKVDELEQSLLQCRKKSED